MNKPVSQEINVKGLDQFNIDSPEPGIYHIEDKEYFAANAINASSIKQACKSIASYQHYLKNPPKSKSINIGQALHKWLLEPDQFDDTFLTLKGNTSKASNDGLKNLIELKRKVLGQAQTDLESLKQPELKQIYKSLAFQIEQAGIILLSEEEHDLIDKMVLSVLKHPTASKLLKNGLPELTAIWREPETGILCKAKADYYLPESKTVVEIKSTRDSDPLEFKKQVANLNYHAQAAHYFQGFNQLLGAERYCIIAVANDGSGIVEVYEFGTATFAEGRALCDLAIQRLSDYKEDTSIYTGFSDHGEPITIDLPRWAYKLTDTKYIGAGL